MSAHTDKLAAQLAREEREHKVESAWERRRQHNRDVAIEREAARNRERYATTATTWLRTEAARLGVTEAEIEAAICRGWLPPDVSALPANAGVEVLAGVPISAEHANNLLRVAEAPFEPIRASHTDLKRATGATRGRR